MSKRPESTRKQNRQMLKNILNTAIVGKTEESYET